MDEDVQNLVLAPFREMVEKGRVAVENAEEAGESTADRMRKSAQNLVKEGDRALKKIEPLCKKHWDEYGVNFVTALKENDEIADFRTDLNDLLWDFDTFVEADEFDAEEFAKLQALARKAAKATYEILMRMRLEHPPVAFADFDSADSRTTSMAGRSHIADAPFVTPRDTAVPEESEEVAADRLRLGSQAGPDLGYDARLPEPAREQPASHETESDSRQRAPPPVPQQRWAGSVPPEERPPEPTFNPWDRASQPPLQADATLSSPRRPRLPLIRDDDELAGGPTNTNPFGETDGTDEGLRRASNGTAGSTPQVGSELRAGSQGSVRAEEGAERPANGRNGSARDDRALLPSQRLRSLSPPVPPTSTMNGSTGRAPDGQGGQLNSYRNSQASSGRDSVHSAVSEAQAGTRDGLVSPITDPRGSVHGLGLVNTRNSYASIPEDPPVMSAGWSSPRPDAEQPGLIPIEHNLDEQPGLMVVPSSSSSTNDHPPVVREPNCTITLDSSFYQLKGFCEGAKDIIRGGAGVRKVRKADWSGNQTLAKCKSCLFELDWKQVEADVGKSDASNHYNSGIGFRLRFISKSHLASRTVDEQLYGCLFCAQLGRTMEESDATVFFTQKQLFLHLSRHPRPLPSVPGLTVVESAEVPPPLRNNYDLHLPNPPTRSLMVGLGRELSQMPTGVATEPFRRTHGAIRAPPDGSAVLQFCPGQRIVGIAFPALYGGEWGLGWADNVRAAFPADSVRLDPPGPGEVKKDAASHLRAVARWRRHTKEKDPGGWLRFDKGEVITNISFPYAEHWCWHGCNSRGRWGVFPQCYMEPNTLSEIPSGDRASILSHDSACRPGAGAGAGAVAGALAKFSSLRRRETRPASVSSGETPTTPTTQQAKSRSSFYATGTSPAAAWSG